MTNILQKVLRTYFALPYLLLAIIAGVIVFLTPHTKNFAYDASADTLVAENDVELAYFRKVSENFGGENFLFLTYTPTNAELLSQPVLERLEKLQTTLTSIKGVQSVTSILDVPLLKSPPVIFSRLATDFKTLRSDGVDFALAKTELVQSPLYHELLISADGHSTAMRINLEPNNELSTLWKERRQLRDIKTKTAAQRQQLKTAEINYEIARRNHLADQDRLMTDIRTVRDTVTDEATVYLAGIPIIASDMTNYIKNDIATFGIISLLVVIGIMYIFFRQAVWVILPVATALLAIFITISLLGYFRQPVTVISANFIALLVIFSISFTMHLIVRYREIVQDNENYDAKEVLVQTMMDKFLPSLYTALTTIVAFASLIVSDILPVKSLGWIMCMSIAIAFLLNYSFFPALRRIIPYKTTRTLPLKPPFLTRIMRQASVKTPTLVFILALLAFDISILGISRLSTEGRFIDYFRDNTEIKQGLVFFDKNIGGSTPMDIIVSFEPFESEPVDEADDFFSDEPDNFPERYWYTPDKIETLRQIEAFLKTKPEVGKIISLATLEEIGRGFTNGTALGTVELAAVVGALPEDLRQEFLSPYSNPSDGSLRISLRMRETAPRTSRDKLIQDIQYHTTEELGLSPDAVKVTGMNVLFNNMLKSLVQSQLSTIGLVVGATLLMLFIFLRSVLLAILAVVPNLLSAAIILGIMGFLGITLDMMTITIAAIIIGIGVDDSVHYMHRFKQEITKGLSVKEAIIASHNSIGFALYFTSITVIAGFSILGLSNFMPSVHFGLLTALAMALSLLANLVIMPSLLMIFYKAKPQAIF